jgi:hypothetical protein
MSILGDMSEKREQRMKRMGRRRSKARGRRRIFERRTATNESTKNGERINSALT